MCAKYYFLRLSIKKNSGTKKFMRERENVVQATMPKRKGIFRTPRRRKL